jgi:hypothetical protein
MLLLIIVIFILGPPKLFLCPKLRPNILEVMQRVRSASLTRNVFARLLRIVHNDVEMVQTE